MFHDDLLSHRQTVTGIVLLLLLSADAVFVVVHIIHELWPFYLAYDMLYSLGTDRGYAEIFQYVKTYWIVIMFAILWRRTGEPVYGAWMLLYTYLLCDDVFQIHEHGGNIISSLLGYQGAFGLRAKDFGELTVSGIAGVTFLLLLGVTFLRSTRKARDVSKDLILLLGALVFCGVVVDMLHQAAGGRYTVLILGIFEDGGEMVAMSATCWYVLNLVERRGNTPISLWQLTKSALTRLQLTR